MLPEASLTAIMFLKSFANFSVVSALIFEAVLPGTLYKMIGKSVEFAKYA